MRVRVSFGNESLGESRITGERVGSGGRVIQVEVPTTHLMLNHVTDRLGPLEQVSLTLSWYGILRILWEPNESDARYMGEPTPGVWTDFQIGESVSVQTVAIPRSDWFSKVVTPVGLSDFVYSEVAIPKGPLGDEWKSTIDLLSRAERAFILGDDAAVFSQLRGAFDALPGAKKNVFDDLPEPQKKYVDDLARHVGEYLHNGRHVAEMSDGVVGFPVNHVDARFAINLVRVLLSYASIAIYSAKTRSS